MEQTDHDWTHTQAHCCRQEKQIASLTAELEQVQQARVHQAQQLAEARQKVQAVISKEKGTEEKAEAELKTLRREVEESKERERQVAIQTGTHLDLFKVAITAKINTLSTDHS